MKPLPIKEQIKVLEELLSTWSVGGMCIQIIIIINKNYEIFFEKVSDLIPSFTHKYYLKFYPRVKAVQKRRDFGFWDSPTIFGNLRRRWFIRHLIKELKKQL